MQSWHSYLLPCAAYNTCGPPAGRSLDIQNTLFSFLLDGQPLGRAFQLEHCNKKKFLCPWQVDISICFVAKAAKAEEGTDALPKVAPRDL